MNENAKVGAAIVAGALSDNAGKIILAGLVIFGLVFYFNDKESKK